MTRTNKLSTVRLPICCKSALPQSGATFFLARASSSVLASGDECRRRRGASPGCGIGVDAACRRDFDSRRWPDHREDAGKRSPDAVATGPRGEREN